jgi:hypothetical protein
MKGDFSRDSFHSGKHYSRVLMQQGRVQVDADWNEQASIFLHRLETIARDLIGPFGGPTGRCGFAILDKDTSNKPHQRNFGIGKGRYYVGGILCECDSLTTYTHHLSATGGGQHLEPGSSYVAYLDVWEEYVSPVEDPDLSEIALDGADTCGRARTVHLVKVHKLDEPRTPKELNEAWWDDFVPLFQPENRGMMKARTQNPGSADDSSECVVSPEARYRGAENQLYRVEIHHGGRAASGHDAPAATLKWSRENGSILFPARVDGQRITLARAGRDSRLSIQTGDWVELSRSPDGTHQKPGPLFRVTKAESMVDITVEGTPDPAATMIRRWDQKAASAPAGPWPLVDGTVPIREGKEETNWIPLEDGIEIQFQLPPEGSHPNHYRGGDYWLIPARTANGGQLEWPSGNEGPLPLPPNGIEHHYAPLAIVEVKDQGVEAHDCRSKFSPRHEVWT